MTVVLHDDDGDNDKMEITISNTNNPLSYNSGQASSSPISDAIKSNDGHFTYLNYNLRVDHYKLYGW